VWKPHFFMSSRKEMVWHLTFAITFRNGYNNLYFKTVAIITLIIKIFKIKSNMKSSINIFLSVICFLILFSACQKDEPTAELLPEEKTYPWVDERLWDYFERFENEAAERGITIDLNREGITGEIMEIEQDRVAGSCSFGSHITNHVTIDLEFWNRSNDLDKEFVIFHELGHCSLLRGHREDSNVNGTCSSIMRSGLEDCRDNYRFLTRSEYVDELFDEQFKGSI